MLFSVVIPVCNEKDNLEELIRRTTDTLEGCRCHWELVIVDDGSVDGSVALLRNYEAAMEPLKVVELTRNYGQTLALRAGIESASGEVIICMDGDLQHRPEELAKFVEKIGEGYDLVSGYKDEGSAQSHGSKVAHRIIRWISGTGLQYFGASVKAFRRELLDTRVMVGNAHRYLGVFLARNTRNIAEVPVSIEPRNGGRSKYGKNKTLSVMIDLLSIKFLAGEISRYAGFFKKTGLLLAFLCALADLVLVGIDLFTGIDIKEVFIVEFILINFLLIIGLLFFLFGILFELNSRSANTPVCIKNRKW